jgi:hypothetical protein
MAIFNIHLDLENEYINLIKDIYKVLVILIVFQVLVYISNPSKLILSNALTGGLLNDEYMTLIIFIIMGISSFYLIFDKIISFQ